MRMTAPRIPYLIWLMLLVIVLLGVDAQARASSAIGIKGGLGLGGGDALVNADSPIYCLGAEFSFGLGPSMEIGGFFDRYLIQGSGLRDRLVAQVGQGPRSHADAFVHDSSGQGFLVRNAPIHDYNQRRSGIDLRIQPDD